MAYTTIDDPEAYFQIKLFSGNNSTQSITLDGEEDMSPNFVWIKARSDAGEHTIYDSVRGATKRLDAADDGAEDTVTNGVTAFDSNGFSLGAGGNENSATNIVAWNWKAGTTSGITTDDSTDITPSSYSFNTTSRISIVQYAGATTAGQLAHGLGTTPTWHMIKKTSGTGNWQIYSKGTGNGGTMTLNHNYALDSNAYYYNNTDPDSVNITLGSGSSNTSVNTSGQTYMCYSFADVQGYSKFGTYTGNGNADGTFVYTGFRPTWILGKRSNATEDWYIFDTIRDTHNPISRLLYGNVSNAEYTSTNWLDICANGFKHRSSDGKSNSAHNFIYMAFAEAPFVNSKGVPGNAR